MTKVKKIWISIIVLLIFHFIKQAILFAKADLVDSFGWDELIIHLMVQLIIIFFLGIGLSAFFAVFPANQEIYQEKFKRLLPLFTLPSLIFIIITSTFDYSKDRLHTWQPPKPKYRDEYITRDIDLDCSSIKYGKFDEGNFIAERNADKQIQTNKITKDIEEFNVIWRNSCEYTLICITDTTHQLTVKISSVHSQYYVCCIISHKKPDYPTFTAIKILDKKNL